MIVFISDGKLFYDKNGSFTEHESNFLVNKQKDFERSNSVRGWISEREPEESRNAFNDPNVIWGRKAVQHYSLKFNYIDFVLLDNIVYYLIWFNNSTGLFRYDFDTKYEQRFFHKNNFNVHSMDYNPELKKFVFSMGTEEGAFSLFLANEEGQLEEQITAGDSTDQYPVFIDNENIVYSSSGIGRGENDVIIDRTPYSIYKINLKDKNVTELFFKEGYDLLVPRKSVSGNIVCIRKPFKKIYETSFSQKIKSILCFPFYLFIAILGFIQGFIRLFGKKDFVMVGDNLRIKQRKQIFVLGEMIRKNVDGKTDEIMPDSWQLYDIAGDAVLAKNVTGFCVRGDNIFYSKGLALFNMNDEKIFVPKSKCLIEKFSIGSDFKK